MRSRLRNVTITLEEPVARWARLEAARQDISVSRLLGEFLKERMIEKEGYQRAMRRALARPEVRDLLAWRPVAADSLLLEDGWRIQDRYQISFWDALIVAAAKSASCRYLLIEDLQADQELDAVIVVNPFLRGPAELPSE